MLTPMIVALVTLFTFASEARALGGAPHTTPPFENLPPVPELPPNGAPPVPLLFDVPVGSPGGPAGISLDVRFGPPDPLPRVTFTPPDFETPPFGATPPDFGAPPFGGPPIDLDLPPESLSLPDFAQGREGAPGLGLATVTIPEPSTALLVGLGLFGLAAFGRDSRRGRG